MYAFESKLGYAPRQRTTENANTRKYKTKHIINNRWILLHFIHKFRFWIKKEKCFATFARVVVRAKERTSRTYENVSVIQVLYSASFGFNVHYKCGLLTKVGFIQLELFALFAYSHLVLFGSLFFFFKFCCICLFVACFRCLIRSLAFAANCSKFKVEYENWMFVFGKTNAATAACLSSVHTIHT